MKEGGGDRKDGQGSRQEARPEQGVRGGSCPPLLLVITELLFKCQRPSLCVSVHKGGGIYADAAQYVAVISTSAGVTSENKILLLCRALIAFLHQCVLYGKAGGVCYNVRVCARVFSTHFSKSTQRLFLLLAESKQEVQVTEGTSSFDVNEQG